MNNTRKQFVFTSEDMVLFEKVKARMGAKTDAEMFRRLLRGFEQGFIQENKKEEEKSQFLPKDYEPKYVPKNKELPTVNMETGEIEQGEGEDLEKYGGWVEVGRVYNQNTGQWDVSIRGPEDKMNRNVHVLSFDHDSFNEQTLSFLFSSGKDIK